MNMLYTYAELSTNTPNMSSEFGAMYLFLTLAMPVVIALLLITTIMMAFSIIGVSDRLDAIRRILEDVFDEKLQAVDREDRALAESEKAARLAAREERLKSIVPTTKKHKTFIIVLSSVVAIYVLALLAVNTFVK